MEDGIYSLRLLIEATVSTGLVVLRDRSVNGGNGERIYRGVFTRKANRICGTLTVSKWLPAEPGQSAMLSSEEPFEIALSGTSDAQGFHLVGLGPHSSVVEVNGQRVTSLAEGRRPGPDATPQEPVEVVAVDPQSRAPAL